MPHPTSNIRYSILNIHYHLMSALAQVKPLPKAATQIKSPFLILPCSHASDKAIGIDAAVVLPNF